MKDLRSQDRTFWFVILFAMMACSPPLAWPSSPLISKPEPTSRQISRDEAIQQIIGNYAHFDVVSYEEPLRGDFMRTFIISYGFTTFYLEGDLLIESDRFCHTEHRINQVGVQSSLSDTATRAIKPPVQKVEIYEEDGSWHIFRPSSPSLIGISGDPEQPLPKDKTTANFTDPDNDGKPGVTVIIQAGKYIKGEVYLARREVFENRLELMKDSSLWGSVIDSSEQLVAGASSALFTPDATPKQVDDLGFNPILLIPIPDTLSDCDELMERKSEFFPPTPEF
jgi:hypothetical protein